MLQLWPQKTWKGHVSGHSIFKVLFQHMSGERDSRKEEPQDNQSLRSNFNLDFMSTSVIFGPKSMGYEHLMKSTTCYNGTNYSHLYTTFHISMKREIVSKLDLMQNPHFK